MYCVLMARKACLSVIHEEKTGAFAKAEEIWSPTGISWEPTISSRIGKEGFGNFLPERKK